MCGHSALTTGGDLATEDQCLQLVQVTFRLRVPRSCGHVNCSHTFSLSWVNGSICSCSRNREAHPWSVLCGQCRAWPACCPGIHSCLQPPKYQFLVVLRSVEEESHAFKVTTVFTLNAQGLRAQTGARTRHRGLTLVRLASDHATKILFSIFSTNKYNQNGDFYYFEVGSC